MIKLKDETIQNEKFAIGFMVIEARFNHLIISEEEEIFCEECFEEMINNYEIFPNYNERVVRVLLDFPYKCTRCERKIQQQEILLIRRHTHGT